LAKGRNLEERGQARQALDLYMGALNNTPQSSRLLSRVAFVYLNQSKSTDAAAYATRATQADETNSEAWIVLGAAQDLMGKRQAAQAAYRKCASKGRGQYVTECRRMLR
jgi:predicted Zn-dependent protease